MQEFLPDIMNCEALNVRIESMSGDPIISHRNDPTVRHSFPRFILGAYLDPVMLSIHALGF